MLGFQILQAQPDDLPIENIVISGNEHFTRQQLAGLMKLRGTGYFGRKPFSRRALRLDAITIRTFYASHGFLEAQVADSFSITPAGRVEVFLTITEGEQYRLSRISISGNRSLTDAEILEFVKIEPGQPYNTVLFKRRLEQLRNHYMDRGKLMIDILEENQIGDSIALLLYISEGETYFIGEIRIEGLTDIDEKYIFRELMFKVGDQYNRQLLAKSQQRIFESGLFGAVEIIPLPRGLEVGITDILIRVRELERRSVDLTVGFEQNDGTGPTSYEPYSSVAATGEWWHSRIYSSSVRSGISIGSNVRFVGLNLQSPEFDVSWKFITPWVFGIRIPTSFEVFSEYRTIEGDFTASGFEITLLSRQVRKSRLRGSLRWEYIAERIPDPNVPEGVSRSIIVDYMNRKVDNFIIPHTGMIYQISSSFHGTEKENNPNYFQLEGDYRRYHSISEEAVFAYRIKAGILRTFPAGQKLEYLQLFELGGGTSLRGWANPDSYSANRGVARILSNAELRVPLISVFGAAIFVDAGGLYSYPDDPDLPLEWRYGWDFGIGGHINTPLGPIRLDLAYPQGPYSTNKSSFQLGFLYLF